MACFHCRPVGAVVVVMEPGRYPLRSRGRVSTATTTSAPRITLAASEPTRMVSSSPSVLFTQVSRSPLVSTGIWAEGVPRPEPPSLSILDASPVELAKQLSLLSAADVTVRAAGVPPLQLSPAQEAQLPVLDGEDRGSLDRNDSDGESVESSGSDHPGSGLSSFRGLPTGLGGTPLRAPPPVSATFSVAPQAAGWVPLGRPSSAALGGGDGLDPLSQPPPTSESFAELSTAFRMLAEAQSQEAAVRRELQQQDAAARREEAAAANERELALITLQRQFLAAQAGAEEQTALRHAQQLAEARAREETFIASISSVVSGSQAPKNPAPKRKFPTLRDGDRVDDFLDKFEVVGRSFPHLSDQELGLYLIDSVTGTAYSALKGNPNLGFKEMAAILRGQYLLTAESYRVQWESIRLRPDETPHQWYARAEPVYDHWMDLCPAATVKDRDHIIKWTAQQTPELRQKLLQKKFTTVKEVLNYSQEYHESRMGGRLVQPVFRSEPHSKVRENPSKRPPKGPRPQSEPSHAGSSPNQSPGQWPRGITPPALKTIKCYNCWGDEHMASQCSSRDGRRPQPNPSSKEHGGRGRFPPHAPQQGAAASPGGKGKVRRRPGTPRKSVPLPATSTTSPGVAPPTTLSVRKGGAPQQDANPSSKA